MKHLFITLILLIFVMVNSPVSGSTPPAIFDFFNNAKGQVNAGVNIHFVTGHEKDLDMIAAAGFKFIRMDFNWQAIEKMKGAYDWSGYDELTANLNKRGLGAIYILDYSNSLYEETVESVNPLDGSKQKNTASPQHPESVEAFASWAAAAAGHFNGNNIIWEIWNEPNIFFWKPKPDVAQYTTLALETAKAIKKKVPEAKVIGPATSEIPLGYIETFFSTGILEYLDAVSVHPYRNYAKSPETAAAEYDNLRNLISQYAPEGKKKLPVISSEWGYSTFTKGISEETQARFIVRMQLSNCLNRIPLSIWYDWMDDGTDPGEREHNFGTVTHELKPKPSYLSVQVMNKQLDGFTLQKRIKLADENDYVLEFRNEKNEYRLAAWTTGDKHIIKLSYGQSDSQDVRSINGMGREIKPETGNGQLILELTGLPQYVTLPSGI